MRIPTLLQKIAELSEQPERRTAIDVDLMLDYTRVLYADLLEWRSKLPVTLQSVHQATPPPSPVTLSEPTLAELAGQMERTQADEPIPVERPVKIQPQADASNDTGDIRAFIGINDKYQIISELFGNDKSAYEQALDYINQSSSERKALDWLREQLWITEESSVSAQTFFEIVERFFASR